MLYLLQRIVLWDFAEFIEAPGRTPPATLDSAFQRCIKCRAVHACLSAGNDFQTR